MRGSRLLKTLLLAAGTLVLAAGPAAAEHRDERRAIRPADQAYARTLLLKRTDLPGAGWRGRKHSSEPEPEVDCPGYDFRDFTITGEAESNDYSRGLVTVQSSAEVYPSAAQSTAAFARADTDSLLRCVASVTARELREDLALRGIRVTVVSSRRAALRGLGDRATRWQFVFGLAGPAGTIRFATDVYAARIGRAHVSVLVGYPVTPAADAPAGRPLLQKMVGRARR